MALDIFSFFKGSFYTDIHLKVFVTSLLFTYARVPSSSKRLPIYIL